jgi:hypothetical protein
MEQNDESGDQIYQRVVSSIAAVITEQQALTRNAV